MRKSRLPTLVGGKHARQDSVRSSFNPPAERLIAPRFVVAVVPGVRGKAPITFATELLRALAKLDVSVAALVSHEDALSAHEADEALAQLLAAGARQSTRVRALGADANSELAHALELLPASHIVLAFGHALPLRYRPAFCVYVTGPHPAASAEASLADLVLPAPSERLASDLARVLAGRFQREQAAATS